MHDKRERVFTTFQIAEMCNVRPTTVIKWANQQRIKAYTTPGGHRRVLESDFVDFLKRYNMPLPAELAPARRRILIIEDEADLGQLLSRALQAGSKQYDVRWTRDGVEGLLDIGKNPPNLVLLDMAMPLLDGARVLATLRSDPQTRDIKVIGMTGQRLTGERLERIKSHTHAFFTKPFKMNEMVAAVSDLLGATARRQAAGAR